MKIVVLLSVVCVLYCANGSPIDNILAGNTRKATKLNNVQDKLFYNRGSGQANFPDELEFDFFVKGEKTVRSRSKKVVKQRPMPTFDSAGKSHTQDRKNQQFYVDENGSYKVSINTESDGSFSTEMKALYKNGRGEKCFFVRGESICWKIDGEDKGRFGTISLDGDIRHVPSDGAMKSRRKRSLVYSDFNPTRVVKMVYVVDSAFINWFRAVSGDDITAIEDAEDYIYMLNNEVNYMYRSIKEVSEANSTIPNMDINIYAQGFYYPTIGTEWCWLSQWINENEMTIETQSGYGALNAFGRWVGAGSVDDSGPFDTATFLTIRNMVDPEDFRYLGIAYLGSVCNPLAQDYRVSINQDEYYDVALTLAHELGHSLGAEHDDFGGCATETYIMSASPFLITESTMDTWNRMSSCSVNEITAHVNNYPGCLMDESVSNEDFFDKLCQGVRGSNQFDIDYQCKTAYKMQSSVACEPADTVTSKKVPARACWDDKQIRCTNNLGVCSFRILTVFDGTPCAGTDPSKDYVCFRGDCTEKVDICAGRTTTPSSCSCANQIGSARTSCCRSTQNSDGSCCAACERNPSNTACRSDWSVPSTLQ